MCPVSPWCAAHASGTTARYPLARHARLLTERRCLLLLIRNGAGEFLLEKRPPTGIWGGLWSFPEITEGENPALACDRLAGEPPHEVRIGQPFRHTFSHFHLLATPVHLAVSGQRTHVLEDHRLAWYKPGGRALGLAAPVKRLIDALAEPPTPLESTSS
jgi:A/G-specific adenine glycosylase